MKVKTSVLIRSILVILGSVSVSWGSYPILAAKYIWIGYKLILLIGLAITFSALLWDPYKKEFLAVIKRINEIRHENFKDGDAESMLYKLEDITGRAKRSESQRQ